MPRKRNRVSRTSKKDKYVLSLYVAGMSRMSGRAIDNVKRICDEHLKGHYALEVIDIYSRPVSVKSAQVIAAPTLIKRLPPPLKRLIGDMSNTERILVGLEIAGQSDPHAKKKI